LLLKVTYFSRQNEVKTSGLVLLGSTVIVYGEYGYPLELEYEAFICTSSPEAMGNAMALGTSKIDKAIKISDLLHSVFIGAPF